MSRAERWAKMGEDAWDEPYTPEDIADFRRRGQPVPQRSPIPGVIIIPKQEESHGQRHS